jgi:amino acid adenylation domain-containing protein
MSETSAPRTLTDVFLRTVAARPEASAVRDDHSRLTYRELAAAADALAAALRRRGIGPEDRVGVHLPRGVHAIVAILGVLRAGAAYLPVDERYPPERRDFMLTDGAVAAVVTARGWADRLGHLDLPVLEWPGEPVQNLDPAGPVPGPDPAEAVPEVAGDNAACVLYTSGSTGTPKGIVLEHRHLLAFALNPVMPALLSSDRTGQVASISFDPFNFELWCSVAGGAEIVVLPSIPELLAGDLERELRRQQVTVMLMPAVAINHIATANRDAVAPLRLLYSGGDVLLPAACRDILSGAFSGRLFNLYGPAETTTACTAHEVTEVPPDAQTVPIGRAYEGFHLYVLGEDGEPVDGAGELHVGGAGVSRGYLNRPELTAQRFLRDPFVGGGARMYATGDRVRRRPDGVLEYLGRFDTQVKIRGYRVEPGEVERLLCRYPGVRQAAVMATGGDAARQLVAFLVVAGDFTLRDLRGWMLDQAPDYLVPAEVIILPELPTDAHGKRDWRELANLAEDRERRRARYVEPDDDIQRYLARLWEDVLAVDRVGAKDDFFALGGHSLVAVQARMSIQNDLGVTVDPEVVFQNSVLADLAKLLAEAGASVATRQEVGAG